MKKYILFLFAAFLLVFSFGFNINAKSASAYTIDCSISTTLRVGSRGAEVVCLQRSLDGGLVADGSFGPRTKAAVVSFQLKYGLVADGIFGPRSRAAWVANGTTGCSGWDCPAGCVPGGYSATTGLPCPNSQSSVTISGVSGPQTLNVNQTGTWTVTASDRNGGNLSYSVVWGDESYYPTPATYPAGSNQSPQQSASFTHSYAQVGIYRPTFTVNNSMLCFAYPCNNSASTSVSVNVGGVSTTASTISSLSPVSGVVGSQVTIYGNNFTSTGNRIKFGDSNSENDPSYNLNSNNVQCFAYPCSTNGSITFTVPSTYYVACLHSTPSCEVATRMIQPGVYPVSVINANGTSNAVNFTVTQ